MVLVLLHLRYPRLDIFAAHRHQVGLDINVASIQAAVVSGDAGGPQPALLNAIYLWACFLSRPKPLAQQEGHFFSETTRTLGEALEDDNHLMDTIRASCLLALYLFVVGRISEGSHYQSAAATLVLRWELYRGPNSHKVNAGSFGLGQLQSTLKDSTQVLTFWQVSELCTWCRNASKISPANLTELQFRSLLEYRCV
jgi:hypothetical protein